MKHLLLFLALVLGALPAYAGNTCDAGQSTCDHAAKVCTSCMAIFHLETGACRGEVACTGPQFGSCPTSCPLSQDCGDGFKAYCSTDCNCQEFTPTRTPTDLPTATPTVTPTQTPTSTVTHTPTVTSTPAPATFVVNSTSDASDSSSGDGVCATAEGVCTLRAAIQETNARLSAGDTIAFSVPGCADNRCTITTLSILPISVVPIVLDCSTQAGTDLGDLWGARPPVWKVVIDLNNHPRNTVAVTDHSTVRGCEVANQSDPTVGGIDIYGHHNTILGNYVHDAGLGIFERPSAGYNQIGGPNPGDGNLSNLNPLAAIETHAPHATIEGNFMNVDATGMVAQPSTVNEGTHEGLFIGGDPIGGESYKVPPKANAVGVIVRRNLVVGGSGGLVMSLLAQGTVVEDNYIGVAIDRITCLPAGQHDLWDVGVDTSFRNNTFCPTQSDLPAQAMATAAQPPTPDCRDGYKVNSNDTPSGLLTSCAGDCDGNKGITIGELQKCINVFVCAPLCRLGAGAARFPIAYGSVNGGISLGELQQCANTFLKGS